MQKHFTIDRCAEGIARDAPISPGFPVSRHIYVPGHSLGEGWTRHIVELSAGDTADNPASTKGPIYGPAFVCYDIDRSGITVHVDETAGDFYKALERSTRERIAYKLRRMPVPTSGYISAEDAAKFVEELS